MTEACTHSTGGQDTEHCIAPATHVLSWTEQIAPLFHTTTVRGYCEPHAGQARTMLERRGLTVNVIRLGKPTTTP